MDKYDEIVMSNVMASGDFGLNQLLQVWRDYYDEIFEVNLATGSFRTMMGDDNAYWTRQGFVEIEVILLAEQRVHPDDKQAFTDFFDLDMIKNNPPCAGIGDGVDFVPDVFDVCVEKLFCFVTLRVGTEL